MERQYLFSDSPAGCLLWIGGICAFLGLWAVLKVLASEWSPMAENAVDCLMLTATLVLCVVTGRRPRHKRP